MSVRAKFKCTENNGENVELEAVTSGSEENDSFFKWTPYGKLSMGTVNENAIKQFEVGKEYYIDISLAD